VKYFPPHPIMPSLMLSMLLRTKRYPFTGPGASSDDSGSNPGASLDKAQLRRAQVRKAQIQHRQRKANYVKQLEMDVDRFRALISQTQRETQALWKENEGIKTQLQQRKLQQPGILNCSLPDDITMTLAFDNILGSPSFRISSTPCRSQFPEDVASSTPDQTQEAINFILSLEHICRHHFGTSRIQDDHSRESGHTMMATSLALQSAPDSILSSAYRSSPLLRRATPADIDSDTSWQTSGLTLQTLYGLACSLSDPDVELTPVQAWFELSARYPLATLLQRETLDTLKRELAPMVRCPHYGAQMERMAYESVVGRVLGPPAIAYTDGEGMGGGARGRRRELNEV